MDPIESSNEMLEIFEKVIQPSFEALYFTKLSENHLNKIKNDCIKNEEYEKVMIVNKLLELNYFDNEIDNLEKEVVFKNNAKKIENKTMYVMSLIHNNYDDETIGKELKSVMNLINDTFVNALDKRIGTIKSREINPFNENKFYNLFEYFRNEAIEYYRNVRNEIIENTKKLDNEI